MTVSINVADDILDTKANNMLGIVFYIEVFDYSIDAQCLEIKVNNNRMLNTITLSLVHKVSLDDKNSDRFHKR